MDGQKSLQEDCDFSEVSIVSYIVLDKCTTLQSKMSLCLVEHFVWAHQMALIWAGKAKGVQRVDMTIIECNVHAQISLSLIQGESLRFQ
jgi:hypothetical protein